MLLHAEGCLTSFVDLLRDGSVRVFRAAKLRRSVWQQGAVMPAGARPFLIWMDSGGAIAAAALLILVVVLLLAGLWIRRLRRTIAVSNERLAGEAERRGAAEDRTRWVSDHDVYTELPRLHRFVERVNELLAQPGVRAEEKRLVALKLAELDETIRALGHDVAIGMAR